MNKPVYQTDSQEGDLEMIGNAECFYDGQDWLRFAWDNCDHVKAAHVLGTIYAALAVLETDLIGAIPRENVTDATGIAFLVVLKALNMLQTELEAVGDRASNAMPTPGIYANANLPRATGLLLKVVLV